MKFVYKTAAEITAMSEYQQEKYFDEKAQHEKAEAERIANEAAEKTVAKKVEEAKTELTTQFETKLETELTGRIGTMKEGFERQIEDAKAEMQRIKANENRKQLHTLQGEIHDYFSTEDGENQLKNYTSAKGLRAELTNVNVKAVGVMGITPGTTEPEITSPVGIAHEVIQLRNIVPVSPTSKDTIKYVQFTKKEGSIGPVDAGTLKPQIDYNTTPVSAPVIKLAGWVTVQDEFLEDVEGARDFFAEELPKAYMDEETREGFFGLGAQPGETEELSGLYSVWAQSLVLPMGFGPNVVTSDSNEWDKIAAGLCQVRRNLRATDAIWVSPELYLMLLINKGTELMYTYPISSTINGTITLGGVPVYQHSVFAPGQGIAGDFKRGARFFQKKAMVIRTSTEHDENFTRNLTTILIEGRVALVCYFPEAFVKFDFTATS